MQIKKQRDGVTLLKVLMPAKGPDECSLTTRF